MFVIVELSRIDTSFSTRTVHVQVELEHTNFDKLIVNKEREQPRTVTPVRKKIINFSIHHLI